MNRSGLRCALSIVSNHQHISQPMADIVFRTGLSLMKVNKWGISFPIFVLLADLFRTWSGLERPTDNG